MAEYGVFLSSEELAPGAAGRSRPICRDPWFRFSVHLRPFSSMARVSGPKSLRLERPRSYCSVNEPEPHDGSDVPYHPNFIRLSWRRPLLRRSFWQRADSGSA